jgi:MipA family protein
MAHPVHLLSPRRLALLAFAAGAALLSGLTFAQATQAAGASAPQAASREVAAGSAARSDVASDWATLPLWEAGLGLGLMRLPHYRGSAQAHTWLLPLPYAVYRGDVFKADREGARAEFLRAGAWHLDLSVAAGAPTRSQDNTARAGMRDLAPTLEFGPSLNWRLAQGRGWLHERASWNLDFRVPIRGAITLETQPRWVGVVASPNVNLDWRLGDWDVGFIASALFGTRAQHAYYFDVPVADATATRPAYRSEGGFAGTQLVSGFSRRFGDVWVGAFVKHDMLRGAAYAASPLVQRESTTAYGVGLSWVFAKSSQSVRVRSAPAGLSTADRAAP